MRQSAIKLHVPEEPSPPTVLVLGETHRAEMRPVVEWLEKNLAPISRRIAVREFATATSKFAADECPDLIVVLQSWSNEYSVRDVNDLLGFAPLARLVVCYGAWCESDGRNHNCWPLSVRVPVWAARSRIEQEWELIKDPGDRQPLPWSASREEVFAADHPVIQASADPQRFLVDSPDDACRQFLGELLTSAGHTVTRTQPGAIAFDLDPWGTARMDALQMLRAEHPRAKFVGLANMVLPELVTEVRELGIETVWSKLGIHRQQ
jgi:hypothetical protein